ncbi:MAG: hypothetical protein NW241_13880, partial [Bacteroidia bacterium]|nr:hypothetical protein [Bacteroidia bacterium]
MAGASAPLSHRPFFSRKGRKERKVRFPVLRLAAMAGASAPLSHRPFFNRKGRKERKVRFPVFLLSTFYLILPAPHSYGAASP